MDKLSMLTKTHIYAPLMIISSTLHVKCLKVLKKTILFFKCIYYTYYIDVFGFLALNTVYFHWSYAPISHKLSIVEE